MSITVETIPGIGGGLIKENDGEGEFNDDILYELFKMSHSTPGTTIKKFMSIKSNNEK
jgi:hypothetical protein